MVVRGGVFAYCMQRDDGVVTPAEEVIEALQRDTVSFSGSIGRYGGSFSPGSFGACGRREQTPSFAMPLFLLQCYLDEKRSLAKPGSRQKEGNVENAHRKSCKAECCKKGWAFLFLLLLCSPQVATRSFSR